MPTDAGIKRAARRKPVSIATMLRYRGALQAPVDLLDISFHGFRGCCAAELRQGEFVSIALPIIGLVRARIVWAERDQVGGRFNRPVDVRRCFVASQCGADDGDSPRP